MARKTSNVGSELRVDAFSWSPGDDGGGTLRLKFSHSVAAAMAEALEDGGFRFATTRAPSDAPLETLIFDNRTIDCTFEEAKPVTLTALREHVFKPVGKREDMAFVSTGWQAAFSIPASRMSRR